MSSMKQKRPARRRPSPEEIEAIMLASAMTDEEEADLYNAADGEVLDQLSTLISKLLDAHMRCHLSERHQKQLMLRVVGSLRGTQPSLHLFVQLYRIHHFFMATNLSSQYQTNTPPPPQE